jgi:hypothetical protein
MLQRAERGIDLIQKEIPPGRLERLPQTEHSCDNYYKLHEP